MPNANAVRNVCVKSDYTNNGDVNKTSDEATHQQFTSKHTSKVGIRGQNDVLITIRLFLLVLNVFMTPLTF